MLSCWLLLLLLLLLPVADSWASIMDFLHCTWSHWKLSRNGTDSWIYILLSCTYALHGRPSQQQCCSVVVLECRAVIDRWTLDIPQAFSPPL